MLNFEIGKLTMNKSLNSVHASPTDIASVPRILKEMNAIVDHRPDVNIIGLSGDLGEGDLSKNSCVNFRIKKIKLRSYSWLRLPRVIRLGLYTIELNVRFFFMLLQCKADIIHVHDFPALLSACIAKKITGAKLIYDAHELKLENIDLLIFYQANAFILETLRKKINIPHEKFYLNLENVGNIVFSTIPITINEACNAGKLKNAKKVMLVGFGVGLSWLVL